MILTLVPKTEKKSRKKNIKTLIKEAIQKNRLVKPPLFYFIDPINCHRIYNDLVIPECNNPDSKIFILQDYLKYKTISQIHIRENGLILEFDDMKYDYITPMGLLTERLNSLGNFYCHELAEILPFYYAYFEPLIASLKEQKEKLAESNFKKQNLSEQEKNAALSILYKLVDEFLSINIEKPSFIVVSQIIEDIEERIFMICYNKSMISLLQQNGEDLSDAFESDFIENCLQMLSYLNYEEKMKGLIVILLNIMKKKKFDLGLKQTIRMFFNTIWGMFKANIMVTSHFCEIKDMKFRIINSVMEDTLENATIFKILKNQKNAKNENKKEKRTGENSDLKKMLKIYYPNNI